jgi:hypothetical protein
MCGNIESGVPYVLDATSQPCHVRSTSRLAKVLHSQVSYQTLSSSSN